MNVITNIFLSVLSLSVMSSVIAIIIILVRRLLKGFINPKFYMLLWAIVLIRMIVPYLPESKISVFNLFNNVREITDTKSQSVNVPVDSTNNLRIQPNLNISLSTPNNKLVQKPKTDEKSEVTSDKFKKAVAPNTIPVKKSIDIDYISVLSIIWLLVMSSIMLIILILNMRFFIISRKYVEKKT